MRFLLLPALFVAVTQAAPQLKGRALQPRQFITDDSTGDTPSIRTGTGGDAPINGAGPELISFADTTTSTEDDFYGEGAEILAGEPRGRQRSGTIPGSSVTPNSAYNRGQQYAPKYQNGRTSAPGTLPPGSQQPPRNQPSQPPPDSQPGTSTPGYPGYPGSNPGSAPSSPGYPGPNTGYPGSNPGLQTTPSPIYTWTGSNAPPPGVTGCGSVLGKLVCQICKEQCENAENTSTTHGWYLCPLTKHGHPRVEKNLCIKSQRAPRD